MNLELIKSYDVANILGFLDNHIEVWDIDPMEYVHDSPNYKAFSTYSYPELHTMVMAIVEDIKNIKGGTLLQTSLTKLPAGENIRRHSDEESDLIRIHIPLQTNDNVFFHCEDEKVNMKVGECWTFNYKQWHYVTNEGNIDRVHLMIDLSMI